MIKKKIVLIILVLCLMIVSCAAAYNAGINHSIAASKIYVHDRVVVMELDGELYTHYF